MTKNGARPEDVEPGRERPDGGVIFELCAETLQACRIAWAAGAARIELCAHLAADGLTPSPELTRAAVVESNLPVFMLLRPRAGDFVYTTAEFARMRDDLLRGRDLGVRGFALGVLLPAGHVDVERTRELVELAAPLDVTFHRAFDATPDLPAALEHVIATGCRRVLTSGGAVDVVAGTGSLAALVLQAAGRIDIAAGGGVRAENARVLAESTGANHFHGSLRHAAAAADLAADVPQGIDPEAIRRVVEQLRLGRAERRGVLAHSTASTRS